MRRCALHPSVKHLSIQNPYVDYAADMTVLLTYHNLMDNWIDDKKVGSLAAAGVLKKKCGHIRERYPRQWNAMTEYLKKLHGYEKKNGESLDAAPALPASSWGKFWSTGRMNGKKVCGISDSSWENLFI